jgi:RNA polymerase sigma-70 factor (ECF subfamily)
MATIITPGLLERVLDRDRQAARELLGIVVPIAQARITRVLLCRGASRRRDIREGVLDLIQEVFLSLLDDGGRLLRTWNADRGMSFENFVGLIAAQKAAATFRGTGSIWREDLVDPIELDASDDSRSTPEQIVASRELLDAILSRLDDELNELGRLLFQLSFVEGRPAGEVSCIIGMSEPAVYQWRSRLGRRAEQIAHELARDDVGMAPVRKKRVG